jgi:hypothetical protein
MAGRKGAREGDLTLTFHRNSCDRHARGLWEIGYQLMNLRLQAAVLGIGAQVIFPGSEHLSAFSGLSLEIPVAMLGLTLSVEPEKEA